MALYTVEGTYGSNQTPCTVLCSSDGEGYTWYVAEGGQTVNLAPVNQLEDGVNIEELQDIDCFTVANEINTLSELEVHLG